ncbi:hypothetical protein DPMN_121851 [Dreissena polymorpha]|uniref:Uncharacterized protein n=1 Tax=Dreissena polymorpha TaxID=45954 RepID=A0A9D4GNK0_DREPO|nr:hypothetical protein DPMN_121851 [Dreissena polymorpha]
MEAGHGKGAPDGIGAVIKRAAAGAMLHGADIVNAVSMYDTLTKKGIAPHLFLITDDQFEKQEKTAPNDLQAVNGNIKIHQIFTREPGRFKFRDVSCFCSFPVDCDCFTPKHHMFPINEQRAIGDPSDTVASEDSGEA